jgi:hypothetical protein
MADGKPRIRLSPALPRPLLVVRGDELDLDLLRADALRFFRRYEAWAMYGVSALAAADITEVDALCETRLERFPAVAVFRREDLEGAGIAVVPTFRRPHVTLAHADLDALTSGLRSCEHRIVVNRFHDDGRRQS